MNLKYAGMYVCKNWLPHLQRHGIHSSRTYWTCLRLGDYSPHDYHEQYFALNLIAEIKSYLNLIRLGYQARFKIFHFWDFKGGLSTEVAWRWIKPNSEDTTDAN